MQRYVYGAGKFGRKLNDWFQKNGVSITGFVHSGTENGIIDGIQLHPYSLIKEQMRIDAIYIAINDEKASSELMTSISREISNCKVYNCFNFINDNLRHNTDNQNEKGNHICNICGSRIAAFLPGGSKIGLFSNTYVIGGGYRKNYQCPVCGSLDRERWQKSVLSKIGIGEINGRILHIAPEGFVRDMVRYCENIDYYSIDIVPGTAMHTMDITNMIFKDDSFDMIICNHVLEHISDESRAISEIKRVLKKDGQFVFSFPICKDRDTFENEKIVTPEERLIHYGQEDHVRLYGKDYKKRFEKYGLKMSVYIPEGEMGEQTIEEYGYIHDDTIIVARKTDY